MGPTGVCTKLPLKSESLPYEVAPPKLRLFWYIEHYILERKQLLGVGPGTGNMVGCMTRKHRRT